MPLIQKKGALFAIHHDSPPPTSSTFPSTSTSTTASHPRNPAPPSLKLGGSSGKNIGSGSGLGGTKGGLGFSSSSKSLDSGLGLGGNAEARSVLGKKTNTSSSSFIPFSDPTSKPTSTSTSASLKPLKEPKPQIHSSTSGLAHSTTSAKHLKPKSTTSTSASTSSSSNNIFSLPKSLKSPLKSPLRSKTSSSSFVSAKSSIKLKAQGSAQPPPLPAVTQSQVQESVGDEDEGDDIYTKPTLRKQQPQQKKKLVPPSLNLNLTTLIPDPFLAPLSATATATTTASATPPSYLPSPLMPQTPVLGSGEQAMERGVFEGLGMISAAEEREEKKHGLEFTFPRHSPSKFTYGLSGGGSGAGGSSKYSKPSGSASGSGFAKPSMNARQKENVPPVGEVVSGRRNAAPAPAAMGHRTLGSAFNLSGFLAGEGGAESSSTEVVAPVTEASSSRDSSGFHGLGFGFTPMKAQAGPISSSNGRHARGLSSMSGIDHFLPPSRSFGSDLADMNENEDKREWSPYSKARVTPLKSRHRERARQSGHAYNRSHGGHKRAVSSISTNHFLPPSNSNSALNAVGEDEADSPMARARVTPLKSRNKKRHVRQKSSLSRGWGNGFAAEVGGGGIGLGIGGMTGLGFAVDLQEQRERGRNDEVEWADVDFDASSSVHTSGGSRGLTDSNKKSNSSNSLSLSLSGSVSNSSLGSASKRFSTLDMVDERKFGSPGSTLGGSPIGRRRSASPGERGNATIARRLYEEDEALPSSKHGWTQTREGEFKAPSPPVPRRKHNGKSMMGGIMRA